MWPQTAILNRLTKKVSGITFWFQGDHLRARCARGTLILSIGTITAKGTAFASKVILARLLVPEVLGLMVVILSLTALLEALTQVGIRQSVIQNKSGAKPEYLNMAWWFQCLRGVGLYTIAFLITPWLRRFYFQSKPEIIALHSMQELVTLVRLAFLAILFNGFSSIKTAILEKELRFGKHVLLKQGSTILGAILTIALAFVMRNIWAVVIGFTFTVLVRCLLSFIICPFCPRFSFDRHSFHNLSKFAHGMLGLPILAYIAFNIDVLVAGRLVPGGSLGMYGMALALAQVPRQLFSLIVNPILLPVFSRKHDDKRALCSAILKITKVVVLIGIPCVALAVICRRTILSIVYGAQFSTVATPFALLCIYVLFLTQESSLTAVIFGIGRPEKHRITAGIRALIVIMLIYPAIKLFGLTGAAATILAANFIALCVQLFIIHKEIGLRISDYAISWLPGLALVVPVLVVVAILRGLNPEQPIVHLVGGAFSCCLVICLAGLLLLKRSGIFTQHQTCSSAIVESVDEVEAESV